MRRSHAIWSMILIFLMVILLSACGNAAPAAQQTPTPSVTPEAAATPELTIETTPSPEPTPEASASPESNPELTSTPEPTPEIKSEWDTEILKNDTGKTLIKSIASKKDGSNHTGFGIVSQKGTVIVTDPHALISRNGLIKADIITISHQHSDHINAIYMDKMKDIAQTFSYKPTEPVTIDDVTITGVAASHSGDKIDPDNPTNTIYVFDIDGIRIAHMGDMGQTELSEEQLEMLGQVDIVFTVVSHVPQYGFEKDNNVRIIQQLNPKIVSPTHYSKLIEEYTIEQLGIKEVETMASLAITREELDAMTEMRFIHLE